jgi:hypothetical protein
MAEPHVIGALRNKRVELAGMLQLLEQRLAQQSANLAHVDATMRRFDPICGQRTWNRCSRSTGTRNQVSAGARRPGLRPC